MTADEVPEGAKTLTAKAVAKSLGVGRELIEGLVRGGQIIGYRGTGQSGDPVVLVDRSEIARLKAMLA